MRVTIGDACTLECKVAGTPELSTGWFKDGKELTSSQKYRITFLNKVSTLKIMDAEKEDGGLYTFAVQNDVGKSSCTASVDVLGWLGSLSSIFYKNFRSVMVFFLSSIPSLLFSLTMDLLCFLMQIESFLLLSQEN